VSQPHAPNGAAVWTTYAYDERGRTVAVTAPDGSPNGSITTTQYPTTVTDPMGNTFTGNLVKTIDPAGKWKIQPGAVGSFAAARENTRHRPSRLQTAQDLDRVRRHVAFRISGSILRI